MSAATDRIVTRELRRLSARLAARSITLREATERIYALHMDCALRAVDEDRAASSVPLALAERRLGEVVVLPDGALVGARPAPARPYDRGADLW